jgi:2-C-methyl-D-erythritol 4-phosphate cytidylyltransferase
MFRVASLRAALSGPLDALTDEASAMERAGHAPKLVPGGASNLKVTTADDIVLARAILAEQGRL